MSDENTELNASKSKCWNCKYSLCTQDMEQERIVHANMQFVEGPPPAPAEDFPFEVTQEYDFQEGEEPQETGPIEHLLERYRVRGICFWHPPNVTMATPIGVAHVIECNRFVKED